jgi:hypothetical protein
VVDKFICPVTRKNRAKRKRSIARRMAANRRQQGFASHR